jgi:hypothetical protein
MTESFNWSAEQERRDAVAEITALRRELKTETAAGAKAAAKDPRFIAAQQRLDAAKTGVGMRTSAQDLAALNALDGSRTPTGTTATRRGGAVTAKPTTKAERATTKALNAPSQEYFRTVTKAFQDPDNKPLLRLPELTDAIRQKLQEEFNTGNTPGFETNIEDANYEWRWVEPGTIGNKKGYWGLAINTESTVKGPAIAQEEIDNASSSNASDVAMKMWRSGQFSITQVTDFLNKFPTAGQIEISQILMNDLRNLFPNIESADFQRVISRMKRDGVWPKTVEEAEQFFTENQIANKIPDRKKWNELFKKTYDKILQERNK